MLLYSCHCEDFVRSNDFSSVMSNRSETSCFIKIPLRFAHTLKGTRRNDKPLTCPLTLVPFLKGTALVLLELPPSPDKRMRQFRDVYL